MTGGESSPIRVNEATWTDLQSLPGIGPRRAERLITFREEISPLRNTFDLATATGLSLKQAEKLVARVDWHRSRGLQTVGIIPFGLVMLASLWMITSGLINNLGFPATAVAASIEPGSRALSAGILLLLGGLLLVTGNLALTGMRQRPTTGALVPGLGIFSALVGAGLIGLSNWLAVIGEPDPETMNELRSVNSFLLAVLILTLLVYGPAIIMRFLVADYRRAWLGRAQLAYDASLPGFSIFPLIVMQWENVASISAIFGIWTSALLCIAATDLLALRSPFVESLSDRDQGRLRFLRRDERDPVKLPYPRLFALVTLVAGLAVGSLALAELFG